MIKANADDKAWVINLLAEAFDANQSVNYIIKKDQKRKNRIKILMEYSFDICLMFGEIWLSDNREGCAMILYPQKKRESLRTLWLNLKLVFRSIGFAGIKKALARESKIKAKQSKAKMSYLWFIGVSPMNQKKGIGSELLKELINYAQESNLPIYLETSTLANLSWYEHFGFKIYDKLDIGYSLYFLSNEPA